MFVNHRKLVYHDIITHQVGLQTDHKSYSSACLSSPLCKREVHQRSVIQSLSANPSIQRFWSLELWQERWLIMKTCISEMHRSQSENTCYWKPMAFCGSGGKKEDLVHLDVESRPCMSSQVSILSFFGMICSLAGQNLWAASAGDQR